MLPVLKAFFFCEFVPTTSSALTVPAPASKMTSALAPLDQEQGADEAEAPAVPVSAREQEKDQPLPRGVRPESFQGRDLRQEILQDGIVVLKNFLSQDAVSELLQEAEALKNEAGKGFRSFEEHNLYLENTAGAPEKEERATHLLKAKRFESGKVLVNQKEIEDKAFSTQNGSSSSTSLLIELYKSDLLLNLLKKAFDLPELYHSADEIGGVYYNFFEKGDQLGWHFDRSEFSINLILKETSCGGGKFRYWPDSREFVDHVCEQMDHGKGIGKGEGIGQDVGIGKGKTSAPATSVCDEENNCPQVVEHQSRVDETWADFEKRYLVEAVPKENENRNKRSILPCIWCKNRKRAKNIPSSSTTLASSCATDGSPALQQPNKNLIVPKLEPGALYLFAGNRSLHEVTKVLGDQVRVNAIFTFNTKPGVVLNPYTRKKFFGA
ncbi:unnamed protein product [Amoebophrya sp. A120]|nr:unnamed protein product [Amoebophrya sp. A120]|eukprot:GSA120T00009056001.1